MVFITKVGSLEPLVPRHRGQLIHLVLINWKPEKDVWELYNLENDYSQSKDLAKENPEKLAELKEVFDKEATDNLVYPIGAGLYTAFYSPSEMPSSPLTEWTFYEGQTRIPEGYGPKICKRTLHHGSD